MKKGLTELVFIIDRSGSMSGLESDTIGGFNAMLKEQQAVEGEAVVTTVLFDDKYEILHDRINIQAVAPLTNADYTVRGSTALLDAIGITLHKIRKVQRNTSEEFRAEKVMFIIITDGQENASRHYTAEMIRERIEHQKKKYGWEFIFFGANMDAIAEAGKIGINADRARNYSADSVGTQSAYSAMSAMSSAFRTGGAIQNVDGTPPQSMKVVLANLRKAAAGLKDSAGELTGELAQLLHAAKAKGGKIPDVDELAQKALSRENDEEDSQ